MDMEKYYAQQDEERLKNNEERRREFSKLNIFQKFFQKLIMAVMMLFCVGVALFIFVALIGSSLFGGGSTGG
jgi:hypothetical protein